MNDDLLGDDARFNELMLRLKASGIGESISASEWEEVEDFIRENILTEDRIQKEYECGRSTGKDEERSRIKNAIFNKAADAFKSGKDEEAIRLRNLVLICDTK